MKYYVFFLFIPVLCFSQYGINTTSPKATLDISSFNQATPSNTEGLLIPKIDEYPTTDPTVDQDGLMVFITGLGSVPKGFYFWNHSTTSWERINRQNGLQKVTESGKTGYRLSNANPYYHNDIGENAIDLSLGDIVSPSGATGNNALALGYETLASGNGSVSQGNLSEASGTIAVAMGSRTTAESFAQVTIGSNNTTANGSANNWVGTDRLFVIGNGSGSFDKRDAMVVLKNGETTFKYDVEIDKSTDASFSVVTPFQDKSSLKLFERGASGDFGFEFQYDGNPDKLYLWSRTFSGNEGIRMTWLKDGRVGINDTSPDARLDIEASSTTSPRTTDGFLIPRIDAFPSTNPGSSQHGMMVFLTTDNSFYFWDNDNTQWTKLNNQSPLLQITEGDNTGHRINGYVEVDELRGGDSGDADMKAYIYGLVTSTGTSSQASSAGFFIQKTAIGVYRINFTNTPSSSFVYVPVATLNEIGFITTTRFQQYVEVKTYNASGTPSDKGFSFVVYKK